MRTGREKNRREVKISSYRRNPRRTLPSQGRRRTEKTSPANCQRTHHSGPDRATLERGWAGPPAGAGRHQPKHPGGHARPQHRDSGAQRPPGPRGLRTRPPRRPRESQAERPRRGGHLPSRRLPTTHRDARSSHGRRGRHSPPASAAVRISPAGLLAAAAPGPQTQAPLAPPPVRPAPAEVTQALGLVFLPSALLGVRNRAWT